MHSFLMQSRVYHMKFHLFRYILFSSSQYFINNACMLEIAITLRHILVCVLKYQSAYNIMPKKGKNKAKTMGEDLDVEVLLRT